MGINEIYSVYYVSTLYTSDELNKECKLEAYTSESKLRKEISLLNTEGL